MLVNRRLSGPESEKDTRHFELDLKGWGLSFEVGDSVAVYPTNDPELVDEIIRALGATGTPTFFINGVRHEGRWDAAGLIDALEAVA